MTFGVWDLFHYGHVRFLERAKEKVDKLVVGICSDDFNTDIKGHQPIFSEHHRRDIVISLECVDNAFTYHEPMYINCFLDWDCNTLIIGTEFGKQGIPEHHKLIKYCKDKNYDIHVIERTPEISTTHIKRAVMNNYDKS
jgi:glycerol-3-phosphate cytidylyltransferase